MNPARGGAARPGSEPAEPRRAGQQLNAVVAVATAQQDRDRESAPPAGDQVTFRAGPAPVHGSESRWKWEEAGLTLQQLAEGSFYGPSHLSGIERGTRRMPADACARAVVRAAHPPAPDDEVEEKVTARPARARLFEDDHKTPEYWAIPPESLLRQPILPPEQMADQLEHIAAPARHRRIVPQILPRNCGPHPLMPGTAIVMTFPDAPPLVYTESQYSGDTIDDPALVKQYRKAFDRLRATALPPEASLALTEEAAEDYRNGKPRD